MLDQYKEYEPHWCIACVEKEHMNEAFVNEEHSNHIVQVLKYEEKINKYQ